MNKRLLDILTLLGLAVSLLAVLDMLARFGLSRILYLAAGAAYGLIVGAVLLIYNARAAFHEACREGSRLLWLRLLAALFLFLLGWYVNAASAALYGEGSSMVADNGFRMFAVIFVLVYHVFYFGFTRRTGAEEKRPPKTLRRR